ncbi:MAG: hypothetical protein ACM3L9_02095, partial [Deltaproteobacteria bacterium]
MSNSKKMLSEPLISSAVLQGLDDFLKQRGISYDEILSAAGVTWQQVVSTSQDEIELSSLSRILDLAALTANAPCFGLEWSQAFDPAHLGVVGY